MKHCDECNKELNNPKEIYTSSVHLPTFGCTITDLIFCRKCFEKLKGKVKSC
ncbi:MAG: hypothetical protein IMZ52_04690 [Actinobacteria bacterium]|nr:hypothetical protein [Actinomycetota bacterium]MBE3114762.1 hypothetical protein [Actinomycetota bacterium]